MRESDLLPENFVIVLQSENKSKTTCVKLKCNKNQKFHSYLIFICELASYLDNYFLNIFGMVAILIHS